MNQVDWSKAPEWAIEHGLANDGYGIAEFWIGETQYQNFQHSKPFPHGGGDPSSDSFHNYRRESFSFVTKRPAPWNGSGRPPAGVTCQYQHLQHCGVWYDGEILYISNEYTIVKGGVTGEQHYYTRNLSFRPIRTPEQIAAEEKTKAIDDLMKVTCISRGEAARIYDAGYRKQVAE